MIFDIDGHYLDVIDDVQNPYYLHIDAQDKLYVSERHNNHVKIFDLQGNLESAIGPIDGPAATASDGTADAIFVAQSNGHSVQHWQLQA